MKFIMSHKMLTNKSFKFPSTY